MSYWLHSSKEDSHWSWIDKIFKLSTPNYKSLALEYEAITQGLMILDMIPINKDQNTLRFH